MNEKFVIINRKINFKPNTFQHLDERLTRIENDSETSSISKSELRDVLEVTDLLSERLKTTSDELDFDRVINNVFDIIKERKEEYQRMQRLSLMRSSAGYTLLSIILVLGIIGIAVVSFFVVKGILY